MKELRIHGRGGQGAVSAAELVAVAAFEDGKFGQAFPAFGGERRGAPVQAFVRLDDRPIRLRHRVNNPDYVVILDPTLLDISDVLCGLKSDGLVLINTERPAFALHWSCNANVYTIPATRITQEILDHAIVTPVMLGALAAATEQFSLTAIQKAFRLRFPGELGNKNSQAAQAGFDWLKHAASQPASVSPCKSAPSESSWTEATAFGAPGQPLHYAAAVAARTALAYPTGVWRYSRPVFDLDRCNGCGFCELYCPDGCVLPEGNKFVTDYTYCKGCGICASECPPHAIQMLPEVG